MKKKKDLSILITGYAIYSLLYLYQTIKTYINNINQFELNILDYLRMVYPFFIFAIFPLCYFINENKRKKTKNLDTLLIFCATIPILMNIIEQNISIELITNIIYLITLIICLFRKKWQRVNHNVIVSLTCVLLLVNGIYFLITNLNELTAINIVLKFLNIIIKILTLIYLKEKN